MSLNDLLRNLWQTFRNNRLRTVLTLLGIIIGTGSIIMLAGLLHAGQEALLQRAQWATETDMLRVRADDPPAKQRNKTQRALSVGDSELLSGSPLLQGAKVGAVSFRPSTAYLKEARKRITLFGAGADGLSLYRLSIKKGRYLTPEDLAQRRTVCVVGFDVWNELLESRVDISDVQLAVDGQLWNVVGVLENKPSFAKGNSSWAWNGRVVVPLTTFGSVYDPRDPATAVFVRLKDATNLAARIDTVSKIIESTVLRSHYGVKNFTMRGRDDAKAQEAIILNVIKILLLGTGLLSLFVGGINIMNIMLVTVTERTREIGIRRALGATQKDIRNQFLSEAALIALTGGVLGVAAGIGVSWLAKIALTQLLGQWGFYVEIWSVALGLVLAALTGITFGLMPAKKAANLRPVDALRFE